MDDDTNGGKNEGRVDETGSMANTLNAYHKVSCKF